MRIVEPFVGLFFRLRGHTTVELTTVGAKSGNEHTVQLLGFPDEADAWLVVASYAGAAKHPAWYFNMARNPDKIWLQVGGRKRHVAAENLQSDEYDAVWQRLLTRYAGYASYQEKTDRKIPIVRLTPA